MSLVPLVEPADTTPEARATLERGQAAYGKLLNTWRALANCPDVFVAYLPFLRSVAGPGELDQRIKELTAVQTTIQLHCRYSASHRCTSAAAQGITEAELGALARGELDGFSDDERLALEIARQLTLAPAELSFEEQPSAVDPELLARARETFSPPALVELMLGVSLWNALSRFHRAMGFELDMPEPPAAVEAAL